MSEAEKQGGIQGWDAPLYVEHTFTTGRTFRIRQRVNIPALMARAQAEGDPELSSALGLVMAGQDVPSARLFSFAMLDLVRGLFIRPEVYLEQTDIPPDLVDQVDEDGRPLAISIDDLRNEEQEEAIHIAQEGVAAAARFRDDGGSVGGGADGEVLEDDPKPTRRSTKGKRRSSGSGS